MGSYTATETPFIHTVLFVSMHSNEPSMPELRVHRTAPRKKTTTWNSPGHRPSAWQTPSTFILPVVLLFKESAREAPPRPPIPKVTTLELTLALFVRPLALQGSNFSIFWSIGKASQNDHFWASQQNVKNQMIIRTGGAHDGILDPKT